MNTAVISYVSPKGRHMQRDVMGRDFAEILTHAQRVADRQGIRQVRVWCQTGRLLASPRRARLSELRLTESD